MTATPKRRIVVYPAPWTREVVGGSSPALNAAIEHWAWLVRDAIAANVERFAPQEWRCIADACNGCWTRDWSQWSTPADLLAIEMLDADRHDGIGAKWGVDVPALVERIRQLDRAGVVAVMLAVQACFAPCHEGAADGWWTPAGIAAAHGGGDQE